MARPPHIVRVFASLTSKSTSRGTGCVVGDGLVLTALHVITAHLGDEPDTSIAIRIEQAVGVELPATVVDRRFSVADDWVLLNCPGLRSAPVTTAAHGEDGEGWRSFGFPNVKPDGMPFKGTVTGLAPYSDGEALQLDCVEAHALWVDGQISGRKYQIHGVSGAPLLSNDGLIGIVRSHLPGMAAGILYATPIASVVQAVPELLSEAMPAPSPQVAPPPSPGRPFMQRVGGRIRVAAWETLLVAGVTFFVALLLVAVAWPLGIGILKVERGERLFEAGYLSSANWSLVYTLMVPATALALRTVLRTIDARLRSALAAGMFRESSATRPARPELVLHHWYARLDLAMFWASVAALIGACVNAQEFWAGSIHPMLLNLPCSSPSVDEPDWSVGAICSPAHLVPPSVPANIAFDIGAWFLQSTATAIFCAAVAASLAFSTFILEAGTDSAPAWRLFPQLSSSDTRRGFERFEDVLLWFGGIGLANEVSLLVVRLRDVYYHQSASAGFIDFLREQIGYSLPMFATSDTPFSWRSLLEAGEFDRSSWMAILATVMYLASLIVFPFLALVTAARGARRAALEAEGVFGALPEVQELLASKLGTMVLWPVHYLRSNIVTGALVLGGVSLIFYRLGIFFIFCVVLLLVRRVTRPAAVDA